MSSDRPLPLPLGRPPLHLQRREPLATEHDALRGSKNDRERLETIWEQLMATSVRLNEIAEDTHKIAVAFDWFMTRFPQDPETGFFRGRQATLPGIQADAKSPSERAREVADEVFDERTDADRLARYDAFFLALRKWTIGVIGVVVAGLFLAWASYKAGFAAKH
jgi:hypothetical protein